jgi:hypothetical protein
MTETGSVTIVMSAIAAALAVCLIATGYLGVLYAAKAQADLAADSAALAAAVATYPGVGRPAGPLVEATKAAAINGASLAGCVCAVDPSLAVRVVTVRVAVGVEVPLFGWLQVLASSRAEFDPGSWLGD